MRGTRIFTVLVGAWLLAWAGQPAVAEVRIGIGIDVPLFTFRAPPELVVIPGSYVYYVPGIEADIYFYEGRWYRSWNNRWLWAPDYNGPWATLGPRYVPAPFLDLPRHYRRLQIHRRMPYDEVRRHWRNWERERYWERKYDWWGREREERRHERRDDRGRGHGREDWDDRR